MSLQTKPDEFVFPPSCITRRTCNSKDRKLNRAEHKSQGDRRAISSALPFPYQNGQTLQCDRYGRMVDQSTIENSSSELRQSAFCQKEVDIGDRSKQHCHIQMFKLFSVLIRTHVITTRNGFESKVLHSVVNTRELITLKAHNIESS